MKTPKFWQSNNITSLCLSPISWIYDTVTQYRINNNRGMKSLIPVICIGNINVGGSGKTPTCIKIAQILQEQEKNIFFLSRGYKSKQKNIIVDKNHTAKDVGDEPLLLSKTAPVIIAPDRVIGVDMAKNNGADIIIMDDGFQNPSVKKDFSILTIDGGSGLGNGKIFPAGPLRESLASGLNRANAVIIIGHDKFNIEKQIKEIKSIPVLHGKIIPTPKAVDIVKNKKVIAFAGIGRPEKFYDTLREIGADIIKTFDFPDHHYFSNQEIENIIKTASKQDATIVTTTKDYTRLNDLHKTYINYLDISLDIDTISIKELLKNVI